MKPIQSFLITFLFIIILVSCSKDGNRNALLIGKWKLINDYSYLAGSATFTGGESNYTGKSNDYFYFTQEGHFYVKKDNEQDTGTYTFPEEGQVQLIYFNLGNVSFGGNGGIRGTYIITNLTYYTATLTLSEITPEGESKEIINLKR